MRIAELWRYPVKSMRGESLRETELTKLGIEGDRLVHVLRPGGRVMTSRTHPALLGLDGTLGADGDPLVNGVPWRAALGAVRAAVGEDVELVRYDGDGPQRFDVLPLSVATDGGVAAVGVDRRRFRANVYVDGVDGLAERTWVGKAVQLGAAVIGVRQVRGRCVMTTFDPDTLEQDITVLQKIYWELDGRTALDCFVLEPGRVSVGDRVRVLDWYTLPRTA